MEGLRGVREAAGQWRLIGATMAKCTRRDGVRRWVYGNRTPQGVVGSLTDMIGCGVRRPLSGPRTRGDLPQFLMVALANGINATRMARSERSLQVLIEYRWVGKADLQQMRITPIRQR